MLIWSCYDIHWNINRKKWAKIINIFAKQRVRKGTNKKMWKKKERPKIQINLWITVEIDKTLWTERHPLTSEAETQRQRAGWNKKRGMAEEESTKALNHHIQYCGGQIERHK